MNFEYEFATSCNNSVLSMYIKPNSFIVGDTRRIYEWLYDDIMGSFERVKKDIDAVLNEEVECDEWNGNANSAVFNKDTTTITCNFDELECEPCTLPTKMLREIIDIWEEEYNKFYSKKINASESQRGIMKLFKK